MNDNLTAVDQTFENIDGLFFQYDEMRHMNTCGGCQAKGQTPGELLAGHVAAATALARSIRPGVNIYLWSDMFDPNHNAVDSYYLVEGDIAGSWLGLTPDITMFNWHLGDLAASLAFFSSRGHRQIIAGYYDSGDGTCAADELAAAEGIEGIVGMMYTTWSNDYSQLESYAETARATR
ncbi:hypothetical protein ACFL6C_00875 [Myxococcota bacterium]